jgi:hypothetical protein
VGGSASWYGPWLRCIVLILDDLVLLFWVWARLLFFLPANPKRVGLPDREPVWRRGL